MRLSDTLVAVLRRLLRDPRLVGTAWAKARARFTLRFHRHRIPELVQHEEPLLNVLVDLLDRPPGEVHAILKEEKLLHRMSQLEAWLDAPDPEGKERSSGAAYLELLYTLVRLSHPERVLETGVSRGFSSTVILTALEENDRGRLYGTDLPAFRTGEVGTTGSAVPSDLARSNRWEWRLGPDHRELPRLLKEIGPVDMAHYDSDKSYEGMRWALQQIWPRLRPGGLLVFDDADANDAFLEHADHLGLKPHVVAKPTRTSVYRWGKKYYVGILRKPALET